MGKRLVDWFVEPNKLFVSVGALPKQCPNLHNSFFSFAWSFFFRLRHRRLRRRQSLSPYCSLPPSNALSRRVVANIFSCSATRQPIRLPIPSIFVSHSHFLFLSDDEDDVSDSAKSGWWSEAGGRYRVTFLPAVQTRPRVYGSLLALHRSWSSLIKALASHLDNSDLQCRLCRVRIC